MACGAVTLDGSLPAFFVNEYLQRVILMGAGVEVDWGIPDDFKEH